MIIGKDNVERLPPPVGTSDWAAFSRDSYCVGKTLILKDLIGTSSNDLITQIVRDLPHDMVKTLDFAGMLWCWVIYHVKTGAGLRRLRWRGQSVADREEREMMARVRQQGQTVTD